MADRCGQFCKGPQTKDPNFVYMQHGQLHLGNFSDSVPIATGASRADVSSSTTTAVALTGEDRWRVTVAVELSPLAVEFLRRDNQNT